MKMGKWLKVRAEQEADKIAGKFSYSSDVVRDMSRAYHVDFSKVQFHTDETAEKKVRAAGMDGLAQGNQLFFGRGILESNAPEDKMLVAHELVHTMQQGVTDGGNAVSEHVPMGTMQYGKRVKRNPFQNDIWVTTLEEEEAPDNLDADPDYVFTEEDDDYDETYEWIARKGMEIHHYATNKHSYYTPLFQNIVGKYGLNLDGPWNKKLLPHHGRHTTEYHQFVYERMLEIDSEAQQKNSPISKLFFFLNQFNSKVKQVVNDNPSMLYLQN